MMRDMLHFLNGNPANPMRGVVYDPATLLALFGGGAGAAGTIASVASIAEIASPILGVGSAVASFAAGQAQASEYKRQARDERVAANLEAARQRRQNRVLQSKERMAMSQAGALSGTAYDVLTSNAVSREVDALTVEAQGEQRALSAEAAASAAKSSPLNIFTAAVEGFSNFDPLNLDPNGGVIIG